MISTVTATVGAASPWFFVCACKYASIAHDGMAVCHGSRKFPGWFHCNYHHDGRCMLSLLLLLRNILFPPQQFFFRAEWTCLLSCFFSHAFMCMFVCCCFLCVFNASSSFIRLHSPFSIVQPACMHSRWWSHWSYYTLPYTYDSYAE